MNFTCQATWNFANCSHPRTLSYLYYPFDNGSTRAFTLPKLTFSWHADTPTCKGTRCRLINMHEDLRRQALESKKTLSRKAQSRLASPNTSRPGSRASSRAPSRALSRDGSDDEDGGSKLSDENSFRYVIPHTRHGHISSKGPA